MEKLETIFGRHRKTFERSRMSADILCWLVIFLLFTLLVFGCCPYQNLPTTVESELLGTVKNVVTCNNSLTHIYTKTHLITIKGFYSSLEPARVYYNRERYYQIKIVSLDGREYYFECFSIERVIHE